MQAAPRNKSLAIVLIASLAAFALVTVRAAQAIPALLRKRAEIRAMEKANADLARAVEAKRKYIGQLSDSESRQELELLQRYKLGKPDEKIFILPEAPEEAAEKPAPVAPHSGTEPSAGEPGARSQ